MSKSTITILVILVVIVALILIISYSGRPGPAAEYDEGWVDFNPSGTTSPTSTPPAASSPTSTPASTVTTVNYSGSGFSPKTVTIRAGDSVTWVNNSTGRMWVASDPHPTHTNLPGFDELTAASPGASWTYRFTVTGSHGYHNHANAAMTGTVIVQ